MADLGGIPGDRAVRALRGVALLLILLTAAADAASRLESRIRRILAQDPAGHGAVAGVLIVDEHNRKLAALNADRLFIPASNTKLFSMAMALERLGPEKRFETRVELRPNPQGGKDVVLVGMGDANLSGRVLPYEYNSVPGPALAALDDLARQVAATLSAQGIHAVQDILGDDTAFLYEPFAASWDAGDLVDDDGAPVSGLVVNDNSFHLQITPGPQEGAAAQIAFDPPVPPFAVTSSVVTASGPETVQMARLPGENTLRLWGTVPVTGEPHGEHLAVDDPAHFAALALRYALTQQGVTVNGEARARHRYPGVSFAPEPEGLVIARHESAPLVRDLEVIGKVSQNLHADLLLSDVAGSREQGLQELARFLAETGITASQYRFYDGSGLSRMNLVTPEAVVTLLSFMARSAHAEQWMGTLPISGVDGSLATRLDKARAKGPITKGKIRAKTGSLNHVSALSGYAQTRHGHRLTFAIFLNNTLADADARQDLIDKICVEMVNQ